MSSKYTMIDELVSQFDYLQEFEQIFKMVCNFHLEKINNLIFKQMINIDFEAFA